MLGVTFATDVKTATELAEEFKAAGVPAEVVHAETKHRDRILEKFARREILQLVNVDVFGEGFDLPAMEVVSFARRTESYGLYVQQFGRPLRPDYAEGFDLTTREGRLAAIAASHKPRALIIDHVGNVFPRHGLPDVRRTWSLDRREKRSRGVSDPDIIPITTCLNPEV